MLTNVVRIVKQKYIRSTLNSSQIKLLELVYKYRFVSRQLVANSLGIKYGSSLHERLEVLVKNEYLGRRFEKQLKLQGIPAAYYLTPRGLRALQSLPGHEAITASVIKGSYNDKTVGMSFVAHTLNIYKYTSLLMQHYPSLKVFSKRDIARYNYFPSQLPDAVLSLSVNGAEHPTRFFFDLVSDSTPYTSLDRRIENYCEFFDEGGWSVTKSEVPVVLLLSEWSATEKIIQRRVRLQLARSDMEELRVYTTTANAIRAVADNLEIWTDIQDTDELVSLTDISVNP